MSNTSSTGIVSSRLARLGLASAALLAAAMGCVQTRPARNAVLNENQYVRKDFLTVPANSTTPDPGWWLQGTITSVSTPNPLGSATYGLSPGINGMGAIPVRFAVTSDKLQMLSTREEAATDEQSPEVTPTVMNAWPAQSVDLEYYVNLDGELTNQYVVNQEAPWQQREWVMVDFDKNDMSDLMPLGEATWNVISHCVDVGNVSTTLVPNSFLVDEPNNYMQWTVAVTLPLIWDDANCVFAYGDLGQEALALGKQSVTINMMYSMMRMKPLSQVTYTPLVVDEKDGIHHKYGFFPNITQNLDPNTGILASQEMVTRWDPNKPIVWYFAQGFPDQYKHFYTDTMALNGQSGVAEATNNVLIKAGAAARVSVLEYNDPGGPQPLSAGQGPRQYGDIRYSFLVWMSDQYSQDTFAGVTEFNVDYRTGEMMSDTIAFNYFAFQDYYVQRVDDYLQSIGAYGNAPDGGGQPGVNGAEWPTQPTLTDPSLALNCPLTQSTNSCPVTLLRPNLTNPDGGASIPQSAQTLYCLQGSNLPVQSIVAAAVHNGTSTVYDKMQTYLGKPVSTFGNLGPADFVSPVSKANDGDFFNAYYTLLPFITYADPATNPYTIPEGGNGTFGPPMDPWTALQGEVQFQQTAASLNAGHPGPTGGWPYTGATGGAPSVPEYANGADAFRTLNQAHEDYKYNLIWQNGQTGLRMDGVDSLAFENVADTVARTCSLDVDGGAGTWQTKEQWLSDVDQAYWGQVEFHEFGHSMGLSHNFMASIDAPHYAYRPIGSATQAQCDTYASSQFADGGTTNCVPMMHTSSIMEYNAEIDRMSFQTPNWLPYDQAAIAWIYANNQSPSTVGPYGAACDPAAGPCSPSGQVSAKIPWNDPLGFDTSGNEQKYLFCNEAHMRYTPFCREGDMGRSPSEIVSNQLDAYEWQYQWRNLRQYHKFWDDSLYANAPQALFVDLQRFVAAWAFDWSGTEIAATLQRLGVVNPNPAVQSNSDYYNALTDKFNAEISAANQMSASYHLAMINQAQDERPAATTYDPFFGDVTQQGIILDKYFAMQDFAGLWPVVNYDPSQAAGVYLSWYEGIGDSSFNSLTQWGVVTMLGGVPNVFPYFQPTTEALFAQDTHNPAFGNQSIRNWMGCWEFSRAEDFVNFFQSGGGQGQGQGGQSAVANQYTGAAGLAAGIGSGCVDNAGNAVLCNCTTSNPGECTYDPRHIQDPNNLQEFVGPDNKRYIWTYLGDNQTFYLAQQDVNVVTNLTIETYNSDLIGGVDDGSFPGGAYGDELPIKYTCDSFVYYNQ